VTISDNAANFHGGGIYCTHSSPVMQNVAIINDSAGYYGGGMYCTGTSTPVMDSISILNNIAGKSGGGLYCNSSDVVMENVIISGNSATNMGGGVYSAYSDPRMKNATIINNSADIGGGLYCSSANLDLVNVSISDNSSGTDGGGIYSASSQLKLVNVSMVDNQAESGGGIFCYNSGLGFINAILWNKSTYEVYFKDTYNPSTAIFSYSDIRGGEAGIYTNNNGTDTLLEANINADPLFIGTGDYPYALSAASPCLNAGTNDTTGLFLPSTDLAGNPRIWNDRVDIGAYEWNNVGIDESGVGGHRSSVSSYPNPFTSSTTFRYTLEESGMITLEVCNQVGQVVAKLVNEQQTSATYQVKWNAVGLPAGIYYYSLRSSKQSNTGKLIITK
jgi:predicted outer membrane repeat protein